MTKKVCLPKPSPAQMCHLELLALPQRAEFQRISRINGSLTDIEITENKRRSNALKEARIKVICKHGLQHYYAKDAKRKNRELHDTVDALLAEIRDNDEFIAELEKA